MGKGVQYGKLYTSAELLKEAREKYEVYHIHIAETHSGGRKEVQDEWKQMMGDNCIVVQSSDHVSGIIAEIVAGSTNVEDTSDSEEEKEDKTEEIL